MRRMVDARPFMLQPPRRYRAGFRRVGVAFRSVPRIGGSTLRSRTVRSGLTVLPCLASPVERNPTPPS